MAKLVHDFILAVFKCVPDGDGMAATGIPPSLNVIDVTVFESKALAIGLSGTRITDIGSRLLIACVDVSTGVA